MTDKKRIKLVEGKTYSCTQFEGDDKTMKLGDEKNVDGKLAEVLLGDAYTDKAGKERFYFEDVTPEDGVVEDDDDSANAKDKPPTVAERRAVAAKTATRKRNA